MNRLRMLREAKGLTLQELAKEVGINKSSISRFELGEAEMSQSHIEIFADFFYTTTDYLLGRDVPNILPLIETTFTVSQLIKTGHVQQVQVNNVIGSEVFYTAFEHDIKNIDEWAVANCDVVDWYLDTGVLYITIEGVEL